MAAIVSQDAVRRRSSSSSPSSRLARGFASGQGSGILMPSNAPGTRRSMENTNAPPGDGRPNGRLWPTPW